MPRSKRPQRERTHDWQQIRQYTLWPEQTVYEWLRPVVLFNESAAERARATGTAERTLQRKAEQFEQHGMASLFPKEPASPSDTSHSLPPDMRQLIVDLKAEYPAFRLHEIATICYVRFGRRPSHHSVQRVLADGPKPSITARRFPLYGQIKARLAHEASAAFFQVRELLQHSEFRAMRASQHDALWHLHSSH